MSKSFKKVIACLLAVLMVMFSVPFSAFAAGYDYTPDIRLQFNAFNENAADPESWVSNVSEGSLDQKGKNTNADFSRRAIIGYNLTERPVKIQFKDLGSIKEDYANFDALGWKKKNDLYIFINPRHADAPPAALAALLAHEALHQDEYNSLAEETYAWTMEAAVWCEMLEIYPESNNVQHPLLQRENTLKQLFEKGGYTNKYIKKTVYANKGYQNLPQTSPGFERL